MADPLDRKKLHLKKHPPKQDGGAATAVKEDTKKKRPCPYCHQMVVPTTKGRCPRATCQKKIA